MALYSIGLLMLLAQISPLEFRMVIPRSPVTVPESEIDSELDGLLSAGSASEDTDSSNERYYNILVVH